MWIGSRTDALIAIPGAAGGADGGHGAAGVPLHAGSGVPHRSIPLPSQQAAAAAVLAAARGSAQIYQDLQLRVPSHLSSVASRMLAICV